VQWEVCNSKNYGVPQNRERVYIVGHLRGSSRPQIFPIGKINEENSRNNRPKELTKNMSMGYRVYDTDGVSATLRAVGGGVGAKTGLYQVGVLKNHNKLRETEKSTCIDSNYWKGLDNHAQRTGVMIDSSIRRLTPTECERLQGFPDGWTEGISDTQRYKCLGNAVTTNVVCEIARRLLK